MVKIFLALGVLLLAGAAALFHVRWRKRAKRPQAGLPGPADLYAKNLRLVRKLDAMSEAEKKEVFEWSRTVARKHLGLCRTRGYFLDERLLPCPKNKLRIAYKVVLAFSRVTPDVEDKIWGLYKAICRFQEPGKKGEVVLRVLNACVDADGSLKQGVTALKDEDGTAVRVPEREIAHLAESAGVSAAEVSSLLPECDSLRRKARMEAEWLAGDMKSFVMALNSHRQGRPGRRGR